MLISIERQPSLTEVPRDSWAPWLSPGVRKFTLAEDFVVWVDGYDYRVPKGYVTDKASIPSWLHWMFSPNYEPSLCASILHDYCYSHLYKSMPKWRADEMFRSVMLNQGASPLVAQIFYRAVRAFGKGGWA